jgi:hypothetical protein
VARGNNTPEPLELVYLPEPSWKPVFAAVGITGIIVGVVVGMAPIVGGAILLALALRGWIADTADELRRLPRRQRVATAVLPATPLRRPARR